HTQMYAMMIDGVISLEPSHETPPNGAANVDLSMLTLYPLPFTSPNSKDPSSPDVAPPTFLPFESSRLTCTPGMPSSPCSGLPTTPPPGLKSRHTTPSIAPGFTGGTTTCFADDDRSVGGIAVNPSR